MRIALVVDPFSPRMKGGDHCPELARELLGRGHCVRGFGAPPGVIPRSSDAGEEGVGGRTGTGLVGFGPDVIVAYDALSPAAWMGARAARRLGAPLVLVEEGFPPAGRRLERLLRRAGELLWGRYVRRTAARVVALDGVAREQAFEKGFQRERVVAIPRGLSLSTFRPGLHSQLPSRHGIRGRILLYVGAIEGGRGLDPLLRAFARTVGQRSDWNLVLAGNGPARPTLRALATRQGIGARVRWVPPPRPEELPGLLGTATLLAAPSLVDAEGCVDVSRALACGLPVLAADVPRLRELVEADGCGLLAAPGEVGAWEECIRAAASSPERRRRWSRRARELAEQRFAWPRIVAEFEELLRGVVEERAAGEAAPAELAPNES